MPVFYIRFLESFYIQTTNNTLNDKENCYFSEIYRKVMMLYFKPFSTRNSVLFYSCP